MTTMTQLLFPMFDVLAPLRSVLQCWTGTRRQVHQGSLHTTPHMFVPVAPAAPSAPLAQRSWSSGRNAAPHRPLRPLRVVRVVEAGSTAPQGGRMRISGRMADVCAELERLAANEAALHTRA